MSCNKKLLTLFLCISFNPSLFAQNNGEQILDSFAGKFISVIRTHEKQRAYLVTDKAFYRSGESIWMKAFILNTISNKANNKNQFLFVDLVNERDSVVKVVILDATNQSLNSRFFLPESLPQGNYWLRAYTRQMAEGDLSGICVKPIFIGNKNSEVQVAKSKKIIHFEDNNLQVTFFPEGGSLMTGINTTVALRLSNANGNPSGVNGYLKDSRDSIITSFTTSALGIGKFEFEPSRHRKYSVVINWHGKEINYPLPSFDFFAGQLSVIKQSPGYKFRILLEDSIYRKDVETYLIGVSKDSLVFASIGKGQYEVLVDEQKLPKGINTFYLFDKAFKMLSERSVYVDNVNLNIKATTDKSIYGRREKVTLNLSVTDAAQHPVTSLLTIAVLDTLTAFTVGQSEAKDLTADEEPFDNLFLAQNEYLTVEDKDLLMMVRGGNTYQKISNSTALPASDNLDSLLYIRGTVLNDKNKPSANSILSLLSNSSNTVLYTDTTNSIGRFRFPLEYYADSTQFAIDARDLKGRPQFYKIELDTIHYPVVSTPAVGKKYLPFKTGDIKKYLNKYYNDELENGDKKMLLPVTLKGRRKINYDESKRVSTSSAILTSDDLNERNSVGNAVLRVGGLHLINGILMINGPTAIKPPDLSSEPLLLVDGVKVTVTSDAQVGQNSPTIGYLNSINPKDIDFIEILKGAEGANFGVRGGNGVILINLLNTRRNSDQDASNLKMFYARGVSNPVLFPITDYQRKDIKAGAFADNRSTIFWNGNYLFKDVPAATLSFYTSDIPANYKVIITGVTISGDIIYKTITFQSK